ncbi:hypothetical protein HK104_002491 [Borealophlyctis nickersoniae]|nr:hypothetical protein HK104_002491 [Borealophlyctis nickersoniae]
MTFTFIPTTSLPPAHIQPDIHPRTLVPSREVAPPPIARPRLGVPGLKQPTTTSRPRTTVHEEAIPNTPPTASAYPEVQRDPQLQELSLVSEGSVTVEWGKARQGPQFRHQQQAEGASNTLDDNGARGSRTQIYEPLAEAGRLLDEVQTRPNVGLVEEDVYQHHGDSMVESAGHVAESEVSFRLGGTSKAVRVERHAISVEQEIGRDEARMEGINEATRSVQWRSAVNAGWDGRREFNVAGENDSAADSDEEGQSVVGNTSSLSMLSPSEPPKPAPHPSSSWEVSRPRVPIARTACPIPIPYTILAKQLPQNSSRRGKVGGIDPSKIVDPRLRGQLSLDPAVDHHTMRPPPAPRPTAALGVSSIPIPIAASSRSSNLDEPTANSSKLIQLQMDSVRQAKFDPVHAVAKLIVTDKGTVRKVQDRVTAKALNVGRTAAQYSNLVSLDQSSSPRDKIALPRARKSVPQSKTKEDQLKPTAEDL